jgi:flavin-binding protein dodecin
MRAGGGQNAFEAGVSEPSRERRRAMPESIYKVVQLVGSSTVSWEDAAKKVVDTASQSLRDLRIAEITQLDLKMGKSSPTVPGSISRSSTRRASEDGMNPGH